MIHRRLLALLLQVAIAAPAALTAGLAPPVAQPVLAAGECQVEPGADGGLLSTCPDAASFEDFDAGFTGALDGVRGRSATARLSVTSEPVGATVSINGQDAGITPLETPLPPGSYLVRLAADGYAPYSENVTIGAGRPGNVSASLAPSAVGKGSSQPVLAQTLIAAAGGYPTGAFSISHFVRDRDGAYWIAFVNTGDVATELERPPNPPSWFNVPTSLHTSVTVTGVATSTDNGKSWRLVRSWRGSFFARGWTSDEFTDRQWDPESHGLPASLDHKLTAYYTERRVEEYWIWNLVPREDGGVSVILYSRKAHMPQELGMAWDNVGDRNFPGKYIGELVRREAPGGTYVSVASDEARAKWGAGGDDFASYNWVEDAGDTVIDTAGGEGPLTLVGGPGWAGMTTPEFQATHEGTDYFLAYGLRGTPTADQGFIFASTDDDRTLTFESQYTIKNDPAEFSRINELRIGPDGTKYLVDHLNFGADSATWTSAVYVVEGAGLRKLGETPANLNLGVAGGNQFPYLSVEPDDLGNIHAAFRTGPTGQDNSTINIYYQLFPGRAVEYDRVALMTQEGCAACDAARRFLGEAGVSFEENPSSLPPDVATSVASEVSSAGYPVLVRIGDETLVQGGADAPAISRILGVSQPILVESHAPRGGRGGSGALVLDPQWLLMVVEDGAPRIVVDRRDGVVVLDPAPGAWTTTPVLGVPGSVQDTANITFSKRYPAFPAGGGTLNYATQRDVRFNHIDRVSDLVFLYHSAATVHPDWHGDPLTQFDYSLWTTEAAPTSSAYSAVQEVSQLIPAAAFYIALGDSGQPGKVTGELRGYVTSESVLSDDGDRFARIVVDLRARGETATDGNIAGRVIAGGISVATETADGTPETRDVALTLLVQNTRLRAFDPATRALTRDMTTEAVHFVGPDEHWLITNNIGLPNSLPCGPDQTLVLDPFSVSRFSRDDVAAWDIGSCLAAAEVAPTVLQDCDSWADVELVLAAETMVSLSTSLPVTRSEDETNWELAYGTRDATVHRIVALEPELANGPSCAGESAGATAAVVRVSGPFIGSGEPYRPAISVVDRGTAKVRAAPLARPGDLAWEREYLALESAFLEANLSLIVGAQSGWSQMFLGAGAKATTYSSDLLATRALLHCNHQGVGVGAVMVVLGRAAEVPGATRDAARCLQDFVLNPRRYWETYDPRILAGGSQAANWSGEVMHRSMVGNVTLAFLAAASAGEASDYGWFVIPRARALGRQGGALATDYQLDHYARLASLAARELGDVHGGLMQAYLMSGQLERTAMRAVIDCARSMPGVAPIARLFELTSKHDYASGIPCVESAAGQSSRVERYRLLGLGLRTGTFAALYDAAGRDLDLMLSYFDDYLAVAAEATDLAGRIPGPAMDSWRGDRPPADRLMLVLREMEAITKARGRPITAADLGNVAAGIAECGMGLIKSLFPDGLIVIGALGVAAYVGGAAAIVGGLLFLGFGLYTLDAGLRDLADAWEGLDLTGKVAGICGTAVSAVMTVAGAKPILRGMRAFTPAEVRASPPTTIDVETVPSRGRSAGLTAEEQGEAMTPRGGSVRPSAQVAPRPIDGQLQAAVNGLPETQRPGALAIADRLGYERMTPLEQGVVRELIATSRPGGEPPANARLAQMLFLQLNDRTATPEFAAWRDVGAAVVEELGKPVPKSFDVEVVPARPASGTTPARPARIGGSDAAILQAADDAGISPVPLEELVFVGEETVLNRQAGLLAKILDSERLVDGLNEPTARPLFTAAEAQALLDRVQAVRPSIDGSFFRELAGARFMETLRTAVERAKELAGANGRQVASVNAELLEPGTNKVAVRVTLKLADASIVELVVAKGTIAAGEARNYADYGPREITQQLLAPLAENVDGTQAIMITEFWPGRNVPRGVTGFRQLSAATAEPGYARALGALFARIWFRTRDESTGVGAYDSDGHLRNINVRDGGGLDAARAVDFAATNLVDEGTAWVAELLRRSQILEESTGVRNMDAFLDGALEQMTQEAGVGRAEGLRLLNRVSLDLLDPDVLAKARSIQAFIDEPATATRASSILDAWLQRQSQGGVLVPAPGFGSGVWSRPVTASLGAALPVWGWRALRAA